MRIRELTLKNYRVFAEPTPFIFGERFTIVAGVNGRGKTAILDGLAMVLSRLLPQVSAAQRGYRKIGPSEVHLGAPTAELAAKVNCADFPINYELHYNKERRQLVTTKLPTQLKNQVRAAYGHPSRSDVGGPLVVYYTIDRAGFRLPKKLPKEVPRGQSAAYTSALFNRTVNFRDFMARYRASIVLENEQRQANPSYLGDPAVTAIAETLRTLLVGFQNLRVQENPLRLVIDKEGVPIELAQLSDGERAFLALVCDLVRRLALANPRLENPLNGTGVVLIDELELHLHRVLSATLLNSTLLKC